MRFPITWLVMLLIRVIVLIFPGCYIPIAHDHTNYNFYTILDRGFDVYYDTGTIG